MKPISTGLLPGAGSEGYGDQLSNTTCFFRNLPQLETIADTIGRTWPVAGQRIAILHFGGSLGCEALSLLILLAERAPHLDPVSLSTDFYEPNTRAGQMGEYAATLFEPVFPGEGGDPRNWREKWFRPSPSLAGYWRPRPELGARLNFATADLLDPRLALDSADVIVCQNTLIHMEAEPASRGLTRALGLARPRAVLACAGMKLDLKSRIRESGFSPVPDRMVEIHDGWRACRHHFRTEPGKYYFELEDCDQTRADALERYAEIFVREA